jgi:hypothetical protein
MFCPWPHADKFAVSSDKYLFGELFAKKTLGRGYFILFDKELQCR